MNLALFEPTPADFSSGYTSDGGPNCLLHDVLAGESSQAWRLHTLIDLKPHTQEMGYAGAADNKLLACSSQDMRGAKPLTH